MKKLASFLLAGSLIFLFSCGPLSSQTRDFVSLNLSGALVTSPVTPKPDLPVFSNQLKDMVGKSSCSKISWTSRGRAPAGYVKGVVLSYARSLCRIKAGGALQPAASVLMSASGLNPAKDVLAYYQDVLSRIGVSTNLQGEQPLLATYSIGMGLGMRESSGKHCEGWDVAAGTNRSSAEAEAGLFQASYNSIAASPELQRLYEEYKDNPKRCLLDVFKEGVSCKAQSILGTGAGAAYQTFIKQCPAFATEYAMTLVRVLRTHFGPLNRKEAQVQPECEALLTDAQKFVNSDPDAVCKELF